MDGVETVQYKSGHILLTALVELEEDLKHNYENGTIQQRALANIAGLQGDLFSSYLILLGQGPLIGRSVVLRSIVENAANILHIKGNDERPKNYLDYVHKMRKQVKNRIDGIKSPEEDTKWTSSTIENRVSAMNDTATRLYATLSDFVHGNNIQYFMDTQEHLKAYVKAIDSYFVGMFIDLMAELGVGLDMSDKKRKLVFDAIERAAKLRKSQAS